MPIKKSDYPPNWAKEIVPAVLKRAGEVRDEQGNITQEARCEWCYVPNHTYIVRTEAGAYKTVMYAGASKLVPEYDFYEADASTPGAIRIVLSTAHLDRNRENNLMTNLASLCQRCHLNHDRFAQHLRNRTYGRYHSRQPKLFQ